MFVKTDSQNPLNNLLYELFIWYSCLYQLIKNNHYHISKGNHYFLFPICIYISELIKNIKYTLTSFAQTVLLSHHFITLLLTSLPWSLFDEKFIDKPKSISHILRHSHATIENKLRTKR